ncbi:hypothetical protein [Soonwooa purpurea]
MKKKIIWSLFDSETAITQKLNSDEYEVYSIGLPSSSAITNNFISMDLSKRSCLKKLEKLPKPDIIFASPPCESWVMVNIGNVIHFNRNFNEYNFYWQRNFKGNDFLPKYRLNRLLGQKTAYFTSEIIKKFKPELWCIENGSSSLIFKYLYKYHNLKGNQNKTYYSSYDNINFGRKPTTIYSNLKMSLRQYFKKSNIATTDHLVGSKRGTKEVRMDYATRSAVPIQLYHNILEIYEGKGQLTLF